MNDRIFTLSEVKDRKNWEGDCIALYMWGGPRIVTDSKKFNAVWALFCYEMGEVEDIIKTLNEVVKE